jgi:hypothetical protein
LRRVGNWEGFTEDLLAEGGPTKYLELCFCCLYLNCHASQVPSEHGHETYSSSGCSDSIADSISRQVHRQLMLRHLATELFKRELQATYERELGAPDGGRTVTSPLPAAKFSVRRCLVCPTKALFGRRCGLEICQLGYA